MKHKPVRQSSFYSLKEGKLVRLRRICPRCGDSFMAKHKRENGKTRYFCGKCKMVIWE